MPKSTALAAPAEAEPELPSPTTLEELATLDTGICGEPFRPFTVMVPLDRLLLSGLNVRRTERDADIASLAEDIAASGLKQNLVVIPAHFMTTNENRDHTGLFEVVAGGRRVQALQLLAADGRLPADHPILCRIEPRGTATESSLSENLHRVAMNPSDEFEAFANIVAQQCQAGSSETAAIAYTAKRFGVTVRHVEGRLRLAVLAPEILEALRKGVIGLESAKAYAGNSDHDLQRKVFAARQKGGNHDPRWVREELRGKTLPLTHALVTFVELENYRAAGGRVEAEMFMGTDGEERLIDVPLLEKLAQTRAEAMIPAQAKADGYKEGLFAKGGVGYYAKAPGAPKGFEKHWGYGSEIAKSTRKKCIAAYAVDSDGLGLYLHTVYKPETKRETAPERDWEAERAASARERAVYRRAARMAIGPLNAGHFAGTALEGRLYYPNWSANPVEAGQTEGIVLVAVQIAVPVAEIDALLEEATRLHDEEQAAAEAAKAAQPAKNPAQPEPVEGDDAEDAGE